MGVMCLYIYPPSKVGDFVIGEPSLVPELWGKFDSLGNCKLSAKEFRGPGQLVPSEIITIFHCNIG